MSADRLREAARVLRERAEAATPGPWSAANEHGLLGQDAWPAWCVSQMRPGFESMSDVEGYITDVADVHGEDRDENANATYIATMHPGVGLALADWLLWTSVLAENDGTLGRVTLEKALTLADLILGSAS